MSGGDAAPTSFRGGLLRGIMTMLLVVVLLILTAATIFPRAIGAVPLTVLSGSMEPTFGPGDLIISKKVTPAEVVVGDIVTYQAESDKPDLITHRVTGVFSGPNGLRGFELRGDANSANDEPIQAGQVMGRYLYHLPYLGYVSQIVPASVKPIILQGAGVALLIGGALQVLSPALRRRGAAKNGANESKEGQHASH